MPRLPAGNAVAAVIVLPQSLMWTARSSEC